MNRAHRIKAVTAGVLILVGVLLAILPKQWIEETFGFEPDGGNGALELALVLVPIGIGSLLLASLLVAHREERATRAVTRDS